MRIQIVSMAASMAARTANPVCFDVIIAGAGIMGLNVAHQLIRRSPRARVLVLERAKSLGAGSSGSSTGFLRAHYSLDQTMQLAIDGIACYHNWRDYLGDASASSTFVETGALWMLGKSRAQNLAMRARLAHFGIMSSELNSDDMRKRFPLVSVEPFPDLDDEGQLVEQDLGPLSVLFESGCGYVDPNACLVDLLNTVRRNGVEVRFGTRVESIITSQGACQGVATSDGELHARHVVNATGPWFEKLMSSAGVRMSTTALPIRIQVAHKFVPDEYLNLPFIADSWGPSGTYLMPRRANRQLLFGSIAKRFESEVVEPDSCNPALDSDVRQEFVNCLLHRLPGLPRSGEVVGFSSMYTVNTDDSHPMVGETLVRGLWACNGFSGHGFKLAPAVGSLLAQQITNTQLDSWESGVSTQFLGPYRDPLSLSTNSVFA